MFFDDFGVLGELWLEFEDFDLSLGKITLRFL